MVAMAFAGLGIRFCFLPVVRATAVRNKGSVFSASDRSSPARRRVVCCFSIENGYSPCRQDTENRTTQRLGAMGGRVDQDIASIKQIC
jgi:hypothetical protein